jgi:dTDP-4-amino-4,6-dideoxygalactose transaminase
VHYVPVHLHPYYQGKLGMKAGMFPVAEAAYKEILTLPLWPGMDAADVERIVCNLMGMVKLGL